MWKRTELKANAKVSLRKNYWAVIAVCFLMAILVGEYSVSTAAIYRYNEEKEIKEQVVYEQDHKDGNYKIVEQVFPQLARWGESNVQTKATRGVAAAVINSLTKSKDHLFQIISAAVQVAAGTPWGVSALLLAGAVVHLLYEIFINYLLRVGEKRFFLESRLYCHTKISRIACLYTGKDIKAVGNVAKIMLLRFLFTGLWLLTVAGGLIKIYEYAMIPFILAENPHADRKAVFSLSRQMMRGNKWNTFLLDLSFGGWYILEILTLGVLGLFFLNPYRTAVKTELYMALRSRALRETYAGCEALNDHWLEQTPETGLSLYPGLTEEAGRKAFSLESLDYKRHYSIRSYILLFFTFSFIGWIWEVSFCMMENGIFANRGVLLGPWLPIYGTGGLLVLLLLRRFAHRPVLTFVLCMVVCASVEYVTSWALETLEGEKWWDYSGYFLNLNGRICLEGVVLFGLGGCAFIYVLAPLFDTLYRKIKPEVQLLICAVLLTGFCADGAHSMVHPNTGKGITDWGTTEIQGLTSAQNSIK